MCARHNPAPPAWFTGLTPRSDPRGKPFSGTCGVALDYRDPHRLLRVHADLWITPLTGLHRHDHRGWPEFLQAATRHVEATHAGAGDDDWEAAVLFLSQAAELAAGGNLATALASLAMAETVTASARPAGPELGPSV